MTHWKKLTNPNYIGSYAFEPGEEKPVTIKTVGPEEVQNPDGGKESCIVAHFVQPEKPLILNKTNADMISKVWGTPYIEDWAGKKITLKVKKVSAFGDMVDAVRVSKDRPMDDVIICEICGKPIMSAAGRTAKEIAAATKTKYGKMICVECAKKEAKNG